MFPRFSPNYSFKELIQVFLPSRKNAVKILEDKMAMMSGHSNAIAFSYGRSGIYFLLKSLGAKNKKVIIPSYTCVVVAHAIIKSGNIPVFLDNTTNTFQPDPSDYLQTIDDQTVMVIFTNLFGITEEVSNIYHYIKLNHPQVFILQDCAHSFFCKDQNADLVTKYGDGAIFGMNISKLINSVKGGMLTLQDQNLSQKVREIINLKPQSFISTVLSRIYVFVSCFAFSNILYRITYLLQCRTKLLTKFTTYYTDDCIDMPDDYTYQMSPFGAEIGLLSLAKYENRIAVRKNIANIYLNKLKSLSKKIIIKLPNDNPGNTWSHFPVIIPKEFKYKIIKDFSSMYEIGEIVDYSITDLSSYKTMGKKCINSSNDAEYVINLPLTYGEGIFALANPQDEANKFIDKFILEMNEILY
ncbi:MAG: DegT/DnrJ/EryC1/StrS family aminotransferase [Rickettsia endosymbiont of Bryobia graminum]|nr:DegT/DnrJ/EryC1/StrS family aminotransferase [Rickettsia endosymbiont of Bryobia graminum]